MTKDDQLNSPAAEGVEQKLEHAVEKLEQTEEKLEQAVEKLEQVEAKLEHAEEKAEHAGANRAMQKRCRPRSRCNQLKLNSG